MPTYGSLFSGIGGIDLGLDRAGWTCAWQVEIDRECQRVLERHWPDVPRFDDVRSVGAAELAPVDLVCGGFPCQDVSVAGRRAGLAGSRSGLWHEFHRVLAELSPRWVLVENVPGLLSSHDGRDFAGVTGGLVELGYGVAWRVLDAQHFGVPQRRRRVFVVGHLGEPWSAAAEVLLEPESCDGDPAARPAARTVVAADAAGSTGGAGREREIELSRCRSTHERWDADTETFVVSTLQGGGKRGHRLDAEAAGGGASPRWTVGAVTSSHGGADDTDAQAGHIVAFHLTQDPISRGGGDDHEQRQ